MENGRKKLKIEIFFDLYFNNFKRIVAANLLFAIPSAIVLVGYYFLNMALFDGINPVFTMSAIILLYPFYAGVVMIVRNIVKGDGQAPVVSTFITAIRQNFLLFFVTEINMFKFYIS